jgi:LAO/AO transport system kinase
VTYSALSGDGIDLLWSKVIEHKAKLTSTGEIDAWRRDQQVKWMWSMFDERLRDRLRADRYLKARLPELEADVAAGRLSPAVAADEIAQALGVAER